MKLDPPALRDVSRRIDQTNELVRSREAFRVTNQALASFSKQMESYDQLLETWLDELLDALRELQPLLDEAKA